MVTIKKPRIKHPGNGERKIYKVLVLIAVLALSVLVCNMAFAQETSPTTPGDYKAGVAPPKVNPTKPGEIRMPDKIKSISDWHSGDKFDFLGFALGAAIPTEIPCFGITYGHINVSQLINNVQLFGGVNLNDPSSFSTGVGYNLLFATTEESYLGPAISTFWVKEKNPSDTSGKIPANGLHLGAGFGWNIFHAFTVRLIASYTVYPTPPTSDSDATRDFKVLFLADMLLIPLSSN